jgi:hypothetical protein
MERESLSDGNVLSVHAKVRVPLSHQSTVNSSSQYANVLPNLHKTNIAFSLNSTLFVSHPKNLKIPNKTA